MSREPLYLVASTTWGSACGIAIHFTPLGQSALGAGLVALLASAGSLGLLLVLFGSHE